MWLWSLAEFTQQKVVFQFLVDIFLPSTELYNPATTMYLMYYLNEKGDRVYTLKVWTCIAQWLKCARILKIANWIIWVEGRSQRHAHQVCSPSTFLSWRQVLSSTYHYQEAFQDLAYSDACSCLVKRHNHISLPHTLSPCPVEIATAKSFSHLYDTYSYWHLWQFYDHRWYIHKTNKTHIHTHLWIKKFISSVLFNGSDTCMMMHNSFILSSWS